MRGRAILFENECGGRYETGYRLVDTRLLMPNGGVHALAGDDTASAQAALRQAYGLVGEGSDVVRTEGLD